MILTNDESSSCQKMYKAPTSTSTITLHPFSMIIGPFNAYLTSSLTYTSNSYTLSNLESLYTPTTGICDASPFTFNTVTQAETTFTFFVGTARTISITQLSAAINCGTYASTAITYSATKSDYTSLPSWLSISSTTGTLSVSSAGVAGPYSIKVFGRTENKQY